MLVVGAAAQAGQTSCLLRVVWVGKREMGAHGAPGEKQNRNFAKTLAHQRGGSSPGHRKSQCRQATRGLSRGEALLGRIEGGMRWRRWSPAGSVICPGERPCRPSCRSH